MNAFKGLVFPCDVCLYRWSVLVKSLFLVYITQHCLIYNIFGGKKSVLNVSSVTVRIWAALNMRSSDSLSDYSYVGWVIIIIMSKSRLPRSQIDIFLCRSCQTLVISSYFSLTAWKLIMVIDANWWEAWSCTGTCKFLSD